MPRYSIIIPSYNSFPLIRETIESIGGLAGAERVHEIIVVDSSDDGVTRDYLRGLKDDRIKCVLLTETRVMPARQRNIGARQATGDVLAFVDSDVRLDPQWLEAVDRAVADGCEIGGGSLDLPPAQRGLAIAAAQLFLQSNEYLPAGQRREAGCLPSVNLFCTKELFDRVGGFPALRASEDVVFTKTASEFAKLWFIPDAKVTHTFRTSRRGLLKNHAMLGEFIITYRKLMYDRWYYRGAWPVLLAPAAVAWKGLRIVGRVMRLPGRRVSFLEASPYFLAGLLAWGFGWVRGCLNGNARRMSAECRSVTGGAAVVAMK